MAKIDSQRTVVQKYVRIGNFILSMLGVKDR